MKRGLSFLPAATLLMNASGAQARGLPTAAQVQAALNAHEACRGAGNMACAPALHYRISRSRCYDLQDPVNPGRILCRYSSVVSGREARPTSVRHDCAYFKRDARGGWRVDAYPDADMCE